MAWAQDQDNIRHMLALGIAQREFGTYIEQGIGTREQFANVYLMYAGRRPGTSIERCVLEIKGALDAWIASGGAAGARERLKVEIRELPSSPDQTT